MEKYVAVHGATLKCKFAEIGEVTDILQVKSHSKHFANDKGTNNKLIATTKEIGQTLKKNTFGNCKLQPTGSNYKPCQVIIQEWKHFYEKITLSNQGKILTEDSKATCPIGGPDCITVLKHGQKAEVGKQQMQKADRDILKQINSLLEIDVLDDEDNICS